MGVFSPAAFPIRSGSLNLSAESNCGTGCAGNRPPSDQIEYFSFTSSGIGVARPVASVTST